MPPVRPNHRWRLGLVRTERFAVSLFIAQEVSYVAATLSAGRSSLADLPRRPPGLYQNDQRVFAYRATPDLPEKTVAGLVPHAGWVYSGAVAAQVLSAIHSQ